MAITDYKLTESDFASTGAEALPDKVVGQAEYVKGMIDGPSKDVIMPKYNGALDAIMVALEDSLNYKGQLTSASNLDNYFSEPGIYQVAAAQNAPNNDAYGILLVCRANTYAMQLYFSRVQNIAYFRTQENGQAITAWFTLFTAGSNGTGSDFNNIAKSGSYGIFGSGTAMHAPYEGAYGTLQVYQANQYITQTFINVVNATTYVRAYNGSVWTAWKTL